MLAPGDSIPQTTVWTLDRQPVELSALLEDKPALLLFYLFDFSST